MPDTSSHPHPTVDVVATSDRDITRLHHVLTEAGMTTLGPDRIRLVESAPLDPCGVCPDHGAVADSDAVLVHHRTSPYGGEPTVTYRTPVCLADLVSETSWLIARGATVVLEVPLHLHLDIPVHRCSCDDTRGQSCPACDGTLDEHTADQLAARGHFIDEVA